VASPRPLRIVEDDAIAELIAAGFVVISAGGGGIPVIRDAEGNLTGVAAVIDKDLASSLLATALGAELFIISTAVEKVALDFGTPEERPVDRMTLSEARERVAEGRHFAAGSMGPKIEAGVDFLEHGGEHVVITDLAHLVAAVGGKAGTRIVRK